MNGWVIYLSTAAGVVISVTLPLIRSMLPKPPSALRGASWEVARPYIGTAVFSLIVAIILVAYFGEQLRNWQAAFLAGYTADSTLQKISTGNAAADN